MVTLKTNTVGSIYVKDMNDGQIGVVVSWVPWEYVGHVVQRFGDDLITLGAQSGCGWSGLFSSEIELGRKCRVQILEPGTELVV